MQSSVRAPWNQPNRRLRVLIVAVLSTAWTPSVFGADADETYFERKVRPILVEHCQSCHGRNNRTEGGLSLASRESALRGGDRGPAMVPGRADQSLLIQAIERRHELKMPPEHPLAEQQRTVLKQWIDGGADWPPEPAAGSAASPKSHWSLEPVRDPSPPVVKNTTWLKSPMDAFILAKLEEKGMTPSRPADRRTLLRRACFDLTGLPPTPEQIQAFVDDPSPDAFAKAVDELLASPAYGERWGRHWLDVVGYSETNGFEFDAEKPNAFRYRDYVIEAFNLDLPYDAMIREMLAGDCLNEKRLSPDGRREASGIGTGALWMQEQMQLVVDWKLARADELECQLDVLGKSLLGLTLACARCHDHKFDPIPTTDYYSLAGVLMSTTCIEDCVDAPKVQQENARVSALLQENEKKTNALLERGRQSARAAEERLREVQAIRSYLLAAREVVAGGPTASREAIGSAASRYNVSEARLTAWVEAISHAVEQNNPIFKAWAELCSCPSDLFDYRRRLVGGRLALFNQCRPVMMRSPSKRFQDFEGKTYGDWKAFGPAFGDGPVLDPPSEFHGYVGRGFASSFHGSDKWKGRLVSPRFKIDRPALFLIFRVAGGNQPGKLAVNLIANNQSNIGTDKHSATGPGGHDFEWRAFALSPYPYAGREAFVEVVDESDDEGGHIMVDDFYFLEDFDPQTDNQILVFSTNPLVIDLLRDPRCDSAEKLAEGYQKLILSTLSQYQLELDDYAEQGAAGPAPSVLAKIRQSMGASGRQEVLDWALSDKSPIVPATSPEKCLSQDDQRELAALRQEKESLERRIAPTTFAIVCRDLQPHDEAVQRRGNPHHLGPTAPRGFLSALCSGPRPVVEGSGRRQVADWIASPKNPLTARVMVNRIWQHHFGRGLTATPDDFGARGERPTHPELLDYLAVRFVENGWSIKAMHRLLMNTSTYAQSSDADVQALQKDPENLWLGRMSRRRLDAECIRDAVLASADRLDRTLYGPPVDDEVENPPANGASAADATGKKRRRSIYLPVRRNSLTRFLTVFDFPKPTTCTGKRHTTTSATQSLFLLNNPFVQQQAASWGEWTARMQGDDSVKIEAMYVRALGRPPSAEESLAARDFLRQRRSARRGAGASQPAVDAAVYADFAHVIYNLPEFILVR